MAMKYAMKKKSKKKSHEKGVHNALDDKRYGPGKSSAGLASPGISKEMHREVLGEIKESKSQDRTNLAKGGDVEHPHRNAKGVHQNVHGSSTNPEHEKNSGMSMAGENVRAAHSLKNNPEKHGYLKDPEKIGNMRLDNAKGIHKRKLSELKEMKSQDRTNLAEGGDVCQSCGGSNGVVDGIMKKMAHGGDVDAQDRMMALADRPWSPSNESRKDRHDKRKSREISDHARTLTPASKARKEKMTENLIVHGKLLGKNGAYSEGGQVANDTGDGEQVDEMENEFDDLVLRDDLESDYSGENSGDELGNDQEDDDERDVVSQVMKSRKKKDKNPHPS